MNPIAALILTIIQTRQAIQAQRAQRLAQIAERERQAAMKREADRARQEQQHAQEQERQRQRAEKEWKDSWAGSRTDTVDQALKWAEQAGVPPAVMDDLGRMRKQVAALAGTPGEEAAAKALLSMPREELDRRLDQAAADVGTMVAHQQGLIPADDDRVKKVHERMKAREEERKEAQRQAAESVPEATAGNATRSTAQSVPEGQHQEDTAKSVPQEQGQEDTAKSTAESVPEATARSVANGTAGNAPKGTTEERRARQERQRRRQQRQQWAATAPGSMATEPEHGLHRQASQPQPQKHRAKEDGGMSL